jgi:hypothetical protein
MVITFVGLTILQVRYVHINAEMIENQFNESVKRSLFQTVILVEENEALEYLGQTLEGIDYRGNKNKILTLDPTNDKFSKIDSVTDKLKLTDENLNRPSIRLSTRHGKATSRRHRDTCRKDSNEFFPFENENSIMLCFAGLKNRTTIDFGKSNFEEPI